MAEYCLLTALVALIAVGVLVQLSGGISAIWGGANVSLAAGNAAGSTASTGAGTGAARP